MEGSVRAKKDTVHERKIKQKWTKFREFPFENTAFFITRTFWLTIIFKH